VDRRVFVDTGYLIALLDPRDALHARAHALAEKLAEDDTPLVTSDAVVLELCGYFARGPLRREAIRWIDAIRASAGWEVVPLDRDLVAKAEARYRVHADKSWSLADCVAMEIMTARGIRAVASPDRGFAQAGLRVLLGS
jgi:predicted nucleic acid-binding protein